MNLSTFLPLEAVLPRLDARDKKHALKLLSAHAATFVPLPEREIYATLLDREMIGCTGMGSGVCIPHGRFEALKKSYGVFARLARPIEFGAADHKPVDLVFLLLTPTEDNTGHLKAIATASRLLRDKQLCENLRSTDSAGIMHTLLLSANRDEEVA